jgi:hypothetical protein
MAVVVDPNPLDMIARVMQNACSMLSIHALTPTPVHYVK